MVEMHRGHMERHRQNDWASVEYDPRFDDYWVQAGGARQLLFYCPWCGEKLKPDSFRLVPDSLHPTNLLLVCSNRYCEFARAPGLPVLTVDEPIYRRLPTFLIATVDKFAAMPWVGSVGAFFGRVEAADAEGFYGPGEAGRGEPLPAPLPPPDLIIQDELHLISGPLGSMAGLYETALEALCCRDVDGRKIRPKLVASTATVRRAQTQI